MYLHQVTDHFHRKKQNKTTTSLHYYGEIHGKYEQPQGTFKHVNNRHASSANIFTFPLSTVTLTLSQTSKIHQNYQRSGLGKGINNTHLYLVYQTHQEVTMIID